MSHLSNSKPSSRMEKVMALLRSYRDQGSLVAVTHNPEILSEADLVITMRDGQIDITIAVQVNGKLRAQIQVPADAGEDITYDNVAELVFATDEAAFLAGYASAGTTESGALIDALEDTDINLAQGRYWFQYTSDNPLPDDGSEFDDFGDNWHLEIIGAPFAGDRTLFVDIIRTRASNCASRLSGTCTAIWSPSKSALKAEQTSG